MKPAISLIVYPVTDVAKAKALFTQFLGVEPYVDSPYYIGYRIGDQEVGLDPNGHKQGLTGPVGYTDVSDIRQSLQALLAAGGQEQQPVRDVGRGLLVAMVKDADGNVIGLRQKPLG